LDTEIADLDEMIESLVVDAAPAEMLTKQGVGPRVATAVYKTLVASRKTSGAIAEKPLRAA
ncbi:MAG: hypothetical protein ACYC1D_16380, partial [Acidimicrobiales bacterium]